MYSNLCTKTKINGLLVAVFPMNKFIKIKLAKAATSLSH